MLATSRRSKILIDELQKNNEIIEISYISSYDNKKKNFEIKTVHLQKINFGNSSNSYIESPEIKEICRTIKLSKTIMLDSLADHYKKIINNLLIFSNNIEIIIDYISTIDVIYNKAHVSVLYNLSKPIIDDTYDSSFFDVKSLRHPLIENLLQDEIYVPNDICLNEKNLGILLYGINAIGKSSLIKSIGICIIMAQTGFFTPCNSLTYKPYHHIFTRIIGNDNIFKGLSTFAVEMLELNNILKFSNENSLILGDELCSGTENNSATGIILSGISAGAVCWFDWILSDSVGPGYNPLRGINILSGSCTPHSSVSERMSQYQADIKNSKLPPGIAIDDGVAVLFVDGSAKKVCTARNGCDAYFIDKNSKISLNEYINKL